MVCTAMGFLPPMVTLPIFTSRFSCRMVYFLSSNRPGNEPENIVVRCKNHQTEQQRKSRHGQAALDLFRHGIARDPLDQEENDLAAIQRRERQQIEDAHVDGNEP